MASWKFVDRIIYSLLFKTTIYKNRVRRRAEIEKPHEPPKVYSPEMLWETMMALRTHTNGSRGLWYVPGIPLDAKTGVWRGVNPPVHNDDFAYYSAQALHKRFSPKLLHMAWHKSKKTSTALFCVYCVDNYYWSIYPGCTVGPAKTMQEVLHQLLAKKSLRMEELVGWALMDSNCTTLHTVVM